jgi:hypothetical protein
MRRGLMRWDVDELPKTVLLDRVARLQDAMASDKLDGFILYTNLVQPSAVTYLTGFTPYWSDGLLLVPRSGAPIFATALSKRVANWIASTNPVSEIVNTPKPGAAVGTRLAAQGCRRAGVLELDRFPGGLHDEIMGAAPTIELVDASAQFARLRQRIDDAERALIERADAITLAALDQVDPASLSDADAAAGLVEKHARLAGAEEAYIAVAPDLAADRRMIRLSRPLPLADSFALRASVAYKGSWVRRVRTFARAPAARAAAERAEDWFKDSLSSLVPGRPLADQFAAQIGKLSGARIESFMAETVRGSYPLEVIASSHGPENILPWDGGFMVVTIALVHNGVHWVGAAPAFV